MIVYDVYQDKNALQCLTSDNGPHAIITQVINIEKPMANILEYMYIFSIFMSRPNVMVTAHR